MTAGWRSGSIAAPGVKCFNPAMRFRSVLALLVAWMFAFQAIAFAGGPKCSHASPDAGEAAAMDHSMHDPSMMGGMEGMDHGHHLAQAQDGQTAQPGADGCECGCDCGTCAHAGHATAAPTLSIGTLPAPDSAPAQGYAGVRLASHGAPPLRPPAIP